MTPENVVAWSAAVQAFAAIVSLIVAGVLAFITYRYMKLTKGILAETTRARIAAEQSASATQASASAAFESIHLMREQIEEAAGLGKQIVQSTIDSAVNAITYWLHEDIAMWGVVRSLPATENLFPAKASSALDHAARISPEGAAMLSSAFDELRTCCAEIDRLKNLAAMPGVIADSIRPTAERTKQLLKSTLEKFTKAKPLLL